MIKINDLLGALPKNTPVWAIGFVTILVAAAVSLTLVYVAIRPELKQVVTGMSDREARADNLASETVSSIIGLIKVNEEQLVVLSQSLQVAQENNQRLNDRVSVLERDLAVSRTRLEDCRKELNQR